MKMILLQNQQCLSMKCSVNKNRVLTALLCNTLKEFIIEFTQGRFISHKYHCNFMGILRYYKAEPVFNKKICRKCLPVFSSITNLLKAIILPSFDQATPPAGLPTSL